jgi:putative membrane protein
MLTAVLSFLSYFGTAAALLALFILIYVKFTPYNEFELIRANNNAAAITLCGAIIGFTLPLVSVIYYTHSLREMVGWSCITCLVQLLIFLLLRRQAAAVAAGHTAPALLIAGLSVACGMLNAVSISY